MSSTVCQGSNLIFGNLKFAINLYFPISFSNTKSLQKSIRISPLRISHKLKRIIIKRCHDFNVYMKLHSSRYQGESNFFPKRAHHYFIQYIVESGHRMFFCEIAVPTHVKNSCKIHVKNLFLLRFTESWTHWNFSLNIFNHKCATVSLQNGFCGPLNVSIMWNFSASVLWNC